MSKLQKSRSSTSTHSTRSRKSKNTVSANKISTTRNRNSKEETRSSSSTDQGTTLELREDGRFHRSHSGGSRTSLEKARTTSGRHRRSLDAPRKSAEFVRRKSNEGRKSQSETNNHIGSKKGSETLKGPKDEPNPPLSPKRSIALSDSSRESSSSSLRTGKMVKRKSKKNVAVAKAAAYNAALEPIRSVTRRSTVKLIPNFKPTNRFTWACFCCGGDSSESDSEIEPIFDEVHVDNTWKEEVYTGAIEEACLKAIRDRKSRPKRRMSVRPSVITVKEEPNLETLCAEMQEEPKVAGNRISTTERNNLTGRLSRQFESRCSLTANQSSCQITSGGPSSVQLNENPQSARASQLSLRRSQLVMKKTTLGTRQDRSNTRLDRSNIHLNKSTTSIRDVEDAQMRYSQISRGPRFSIYSIDEIGGSPKPRTTTMSTRTYGSNLLPTDYDHYQIPGKSASMCSQVSTFSQRKSSLGLNNTSTTDLAKHRLKRQESVLSTMNIEPIDEENTTAIVETPNPRKRRGSMASEVYERRNSLATQISPSGLNLVLGAHKDLADLGTTLQQKEDSRQSSASSTPPI